jgi:hypothetical protein
VYARRTRDTSACSGLGPLRCGIASALPLRVEGHAAEAWEGRDMTIEVARHFLLWCTIIDYGVLLAWFLVFVLAHDWMQRLHGKWFHLSREQFDAIHYAGLAIFKIGIILFNLVPCIVLFVLS